MPRAFWRIRIFFQGQVVLSFFTRISFRAYQGISFFLILFCDDGRLDFFGGMEIFCGSFPYMFGLVVVTGVIGYMEKGGLSPNRPGLTSFFGFIFIKKRDDFIG